MSAMATARPAPSPLPQLNRLQMIGLVVGVVGLALLGILFVVLGAKSFFQAYLFGYVFAISLALGCLGFLILQNISGGQWGLAARRMFEAGAMTLPAMAVLFIPIALTVTVFGNEGILYHWSDPAFVAGDPIVAGKSWWLNPTAFLTRTVIYFLIWIGIAYLLRSWSLEQDRTGNPKIKDRMRMLAGPAAALFILSTTFAFFDWGMSLDAHWFSTIYGVVFIVGSGLITLAFMIVMLRLLYDKEPMEGVVSAKPIHDLAKLMLAFTVLWTYTNFSQYVIIWSGNVAEFTPWFQRRTVGGWQWFIPFLIIFNFFVPFFLLLDRSRKRNIARIAYVALWMIFVRLVDVTFYFLPEFYETVFDVNPLVFGAPIGLAGIWVFLFINNLKRHPLLPFNDPGMIFLEHSGGGH